MKSLRRHVVGLAGAAALTSATLAGLAPTAAHAGSLAAAGVPPNQANYSGAANGTLIHVGALSTSTLKLAGVEQAFSAATVASQGLAGPVQNEEQALMQPNEAGHQAYGRGTGAEVGIGTTITPTPATDPNQIILAGLAESVATPNSPPVTKQVGPVDASPILKAALLTGQAATVFDPNVCVVGQPISFGDGHATNVQAVTTVPLVDTADAHTASDSFLVPNGDGSWGLSTAVAETTAPIGVAGAANGLTTPLTITIAGPYGLQAIASGSAGGAVVKRIGDPLITLTGAAGAQLFSLKLSQITGATGAHIAIPPAPATPILDISIGEPIRAQVAPGVLPDPTKGPVLAADGTSAAGAEDLVRIHVALPGVTVADVAVGHMEASAKVPAGGIACTIPVSKVANPQTVTAGGTFDWLITIPSVPIPFGCDLINLSATDDVTVFSGKPQYVLESADHNGVITNNNHIVWSSLGSYHPGDPPIVLDIHGSVPKGSDAGVLQDTANVSAQLGNCKGGAAGQGLVGLAQLTANNVGVTGNVTIQGPGIGALPKNPLPRTGGHNPWLPWVALSLVGSAVGFRLIRRTTS
jgi:hypothetical protein